MYEIFGYGEDSFTLWALENKIDDILSELNDKSKPGDCLVFYRPSFGRGGRWQVNFGEFDAILASSENIYLLESKWDSFSLNKNKNSIPKLEEKQILRHKIFVWYYNKWNSLTFCKWEDFYSKFKADFKNQFPKKEFAPPESLLARNMEFLLRILKDHCEKKLFTCSEPKNILLYFCHKASGKETSEITLDKVKFTVVSIDYSEYITGNFIPLHKFRNDYRKIALPRWRTFGKVKYEKHKYKLKRYLSGNMYKKYR